MRCIWFYVLITGIFASGCGWASPPERTPEQAARDVTDRLVAITEFRTYTTTEQPIQDNSLRVKFGENFDHRSGQTYRTRFQVNYSKEQDVNGLLLGMSHDSGTMSVYVNGSRIDRNTIRRAHDWAYTDYGLYRYGRYVNLNLQEGENEIELRFAPSSGQTEVRFGVIRADNGLRNPALEYIHEEGEHPLQIAIVGRDNWVSPVLHEVTALAGPLDLSDWRYFTGTFLDAIITMQEQIPGLDYNDFINTHLDFFLSHKNKIASERERYGLRYSPFGHYFRYNLLDDIGMQAVPYLERIRRSYANYEDAQEYEIMRDIADFILQDADRLPDGTWARFTPDTMSVWADDLFMGSIILNRMSTLTGDPKYINESVFQTKSFDSLLLDEETGVYWHGYFSWNDAHSSSKWGRANGWTMLAKTDLLLNLPENHPDFDTILEIFVNHARALKALQSSDGRWHQILDNPDTYLETSCTAMFVRAFAEGVLQGWLSKDEFNSSIQLGWVGVLSQIDDDGTVQGIVRGTPIMFSDEEYHNWLPRPHDPRGLGAVLLAAATMHRYLQLPQ